MSLPNNFQFTQSNLQDYVECQRRFELRHLLRVRWPARLVDTAQEQEKWMERGSSFHFLLFQHFIGLEAEILEKTIRDPILAQWWQNFLSWLKREEPGGMKFPEHTLYAEIAGRKVAAKYDLIVRLENEKMLIIDWKTSRMRPPNAVIRSRIQSNLYPLLLVLAGMGLQANRSIILPENVDMLYWFANHTDNAMCIHYDESSFDKDLLTVSALIDEICAKEPGNFSLASNQKSCSFCTYRSLCDQDVKPGSIEQMDGSLEESELSSIFQLLESDLDQIGEAWL